MGVLSMSNNEEYKIYEYHIKAVHITIKCLQKPTQDTNLDLMTIKINYSVFSEKEYSYSPVYYMHGYGLTFAKSFIDILADIQEKIYLLHIIHKSSLECKKHYAEIKNILTKHYIRKWGV
jgi:hypothetical protein